MRKSLGVLLGTVLVLFTLSHFISSYREGTHNYYHLVIVCGMTLILLYTFIGRRRRK